MWEPDLQGPTCGQQQEAHVEHQELHKLTQHTLLSQSKAPAWHQQSWKEGALQRSHVKGSRMSEHWEVGWSNENQGLKLERCLCLVERS